MPKSSPKRKRRNAAPASLPPSSRKIASKNTRPWLGSAPPRVVVWTTADYTSLMRRLAAKAGRDPNEIPTLPFRALRMRELVKLSGLSQSTIYLLMARGAFPKGMPADVSSIVAATPESETGAR